MRAPKAKGKNPSPVGHESRPRGIGARRGAGCQGGHRCPWLGVSVMLTLSPLCHLFAPTFPEAVILPRGDVAFGELLEAGQSAACFVWAVGIPALAQAGDFFHEPPRLCQDGAPGLSKLALLGTVLVFFSSKPSSRQPSGKKAGAFRGHAGGR